jgi:vitamin B12 transporter
LKRHARDPAASGGRARAHGELDVKSYCLWSAAALLSAAPCLATAQDVLADSVVVTATRTSQDIGRVGSSISVLTRADIQRSQSVAVADILSSVPGVGLSRNGGPGGITSLRIRGAEADHTVVLIDGVKLNNPSSPGGGFDFANLLVGDLARIEVLRGPQSTLYGSQALGGVVNLISATGDTPLGGGGDVEIGELESRRVRAALRGRQGRLGYQASAGYFTTAGVSSLDRRLGGIESDGYENTAVQGRLTFAASDILSFETRAWWARGEAGVDGFPPPNYSFADTPETSTTEERILYAGAGLTLLEGRSRTRLGLSGTRIERESLDPTLPVPVTFASRGQNDRIEVQSELDLTPSVQLVGGGELETSRLRTASPSPFDPDPAPQRIRSELNAVYAQVQATPVSWLTATFGVRHSDHDRSGGATNYRATLAARFNNGDTVLRAAAADAFKAPTPFQLFSDYGNAALDPEEASSVEAGVEHAMLDRRLIGAVTWFSRETDNQIDFVSCFSTTSPICANRPFGTYDNVARARATGLEANLEARPVEGLLLKASHAYLDARNRSAGSVNFGKRLARRPEHATTLTAAWRLTSGLDLSASYQRIGDSFDNASNTVALGSYDLVTLRFSQPLGPVWSVYGRIENASDEVYQTTATYGALPRQAFIGLRAAF